MYTVSAGAAAADDPRETFTLRPEGPRRRCALTSSTAWGRALRWQNFYVVPNFRHERRSPGACVSTTRPGRGARSEDPALDAEVIALALTYLHRLGITGERTEINSVGCPSAARATGRRCSRR